MSITRTIFTTEEATEQFGEYLTTLRIMGIAIEYQGWEDKTYFGILVTAALDTIEEFKQDEVTG